MKHLRNIRRNCRRFAQGRREKHYFGYFGPDFSKLGKNTAIDFGKIFGTSSLEGTIAVLIRLYRAKRVHGVGTAKTNWPLVQYLRHDQDILPGRRYHHLTPGCRKGTPYHGNDASNLLLLKTTRHSEWHRAFNGRTLEEIIILLLFLHKTGRALCGLLEFCYGKLCSRKIRRGKHREHLLQQFHWRLCRFAISRAI